MLTSCERGFRRQPGLRAARLRRVRPPGAARGGRRRVVRPVSRLIGSGDARTASIEAAAEQALNARIVELTLLMAELEGGSATLLQAWAPFAEHRRGEPEDVIPEFVVAHGIDLVIMGTVARSGIAGLLVGNTAERVLRKLPCSVLAVKPDGFVSPVRLDSV